MKKIILYLVPLLVFLLIGLTYCSTVEAKTKVLIDGKEIKYDVQPVIKNGVTLVPLRHTVEALGVQVKWEKNKVTTVDKNMKVILYTGKTLAYKNNQKIALEVPPTIIKGRTFIPIRFLSEAYGYHVNWNSKDKEVLIFSTKEKEKAYQMSHLEIPVLMYHILTKGQNDTISTDPERFKEHMTTLKKAGYNTITVFDLHNYLVKGTSLPENPLLITFDDGYISNYRDAYPVLKELNMKATIFVIASRIFEERDISNGEMEKFTWKQAREMKDTITIQSHTWDSHSKKKSPTGKERGMIASRVVINGKLETQKEFEERIYQDLRKSEEVIEEKMGYENISIAYPYGDHSDDTIRIAQKAGYEIGFTVKKGLVSKGDNLLKLNRITADGAYSGKELVEVIQSY